MGRSFQVVVTVCRTNKTPVAPPSLRRERERERERLRMPAELFTRQPGTPAALSDHSVFEQVCAAFPTRHPTLSLLVYPDSSDS